MKKELELNKSPDIISYAHHAYLNAIAKRTKIAVVYIESLVQDDWKVVENDIECELDKQKDMMTLSERKNRLADKVFLERKCKRDDKVVLKLIDINLINSLSYVKVNIEQWNGDRTEKNILFSFYWNQYDITFGDEKYKYSNHFKAYYKLLLENECVKVLISPDKAAWECIHENEIEIKGENELSFRVEVFFGDSQYVKWLNMNYLQLFFNENDSNEVYLDYYTFPRKGIDASYNQVCHFIDTEHIEYIKIKEKTNFNIHSYIENAIKDDYYLCISLDEYYVPNRSAYNKFFYEHYNLLFGFDDDKREYNLMGYDNNGKIVNNTISYDVLENAIGEKIIMRYRFTVNSYMFQFNVEYLKEILSEFLEGKNSSIRYANIMTTKVGDYGIKVFDNFLNGEIGFQLFQKDKRISYLFYEHALLNRDRLDYLIKEKLVRENEIINLRNKANEMLKIAEIVKNLVIKNMFKPQRNSILEMLTKLKQIEKDYFTLLLECLN